MRMEYRFTPIQKETGNKDNSRQGQAKEAQLKEAQSTEVQSKEVAIAAEEDKSKDQRKDNGNEQEARRPKLNPLATPTLKNLGIKNRKPATAPLRTRREITQVSNRVDSVFAHPCTNLHRLPSRIQLTPQTAAIILRIRLNRKA
jgi:hypothetical protein